MDLGQPAAQLWAALGSQLSGRPVCAGNSKVLGLPGPRSASQLPSQWPRPSLPPAPPSPSGVMSLPGRICSESRAGHWGPSSGPAGNSPLAPPWWPGPTSCPLPQHCILGLSAVSLPPGPTSVSPWTHANARALILCLVPPSLAGCAALGVPRASICTSHSTWPSVGSPGSASRAGWGLLPARASRGP